MIGVGPNNRRVPQRRLAEIGSSYLIRRAAPLIGTSTHDPPASRASLELLLFISHFLLFLAKQQLKSLQNGAVSIKARS